MTLKPKKTILFDASIFKRLYQALARFNPVKYVEAQEVRALVTPSMVAWFSVVRLMLGN